MAQDPASISRELLRFQRRRRVLRLKQGAPQLGTAEANVLFSLDRRPGAAAGEIAKEIGIDKSVVSRLVTRLERDGLLASRPSAKDKRRQELLLTEASRTVLRELDSSQEQILGICFSELSSAEIDTLAAYLRRLADGLGAPRLQQRPSDHSVTFQLRRLTQALDANSDGGPALPLPHLQLLDLLAELDGWSSVSTLNVGTGHEFSLVSRALTALSAQELIARRINPNDARSAQYSLLSKGRELRQRILAANDERLTAATGMWRHKERDDLLRLLRTCSRTPSSGDPMLADERTVLRQLKTVDEMAEARVFYMELLRSKEQLPLLGAVLFSPAALAFACSRNGILRAVCSFEKGEGRWQLCCFASTFPPGESKDRFLQPILHMLRQVHRVKGFELADRTVSGEMAAMVAELQSEMDQSAPATAGAAAGRGGRSR